jgi:hypothetical protein
MPPARLRFAQGDRAGGMESAARAVEDARRITRDESARKAETYAHRTLAIEAAIAQRAGEALDEIAAGIGAPPAAVTRCSIGLAVDDDRVLAVTRDARGDDAAQIERRAAADVPTDEIVPAAARARLAGCDAVRVLALPPLHGSPRLFEASVAWGYTSRAPAQTAQLETSRRLVVSDVKPPSSLGLPPLATWGAQRGGTWLHGEDATPGRVLAAMRGATEIEIHAHGYVDTAQSAASIIALSPESDGRFALSAADFAGARLGGNPIVILGACHAAKTARYYRSAWSLPSALVTAGARAVLASSEEIRDAEAGDFFDAVLARVRAGAAPAVALRDERTVWLARDGASWVRNVIAFE